MPSYVITTNDKHERVLTWLKDNKSEYKDSTNQQIISNELLNNFKKIVSEIYQIEIIEEEIKTDQAKNFDTKVQELIDNGDI